jgi:hypothetical protein
VRKVIIGVIMGFLAISLLPKALTVSAANVTNITLSVTSGPPGTVVMVTGSGFSAAEYNVTFGGNLVIPTTPIAGGAISASFVVPMLPRTGSPYPVVLTATGDTVNIPVFNITPAIWLDSSSGFVGDVIQVNGYGFLASTNLEVSFDGIDTVSAVSDSSGSFSSTNLQIPESKAGWHTIAARDYIGASQGIVYVVAPKVSLSTSTSDAGSSIVCSGKGFAAMSNISFFLDNTPFSSTGATDANGTLQPITLTLPTVAGGLHTLKAQDGSGNSAITSLSVTSNISISPASGPSGTLVSLSGSGFQANENVSITYNGAIVTTVPSPVQSDTAGSFTVSFNVPPLPGGAYEIVASDSINSAKAQFTSSAAATINPVEGTAGTKITASGTGFRPRGSIAINYDGVQVAVGSSDIYGNFSVRFAAPSSSTGLHQVTITDKTSTLNFTFGIEPTIMINPVSGYVGSKITIDASGFSANKMIIVKYDDIQLASGQTDSNGALNIAENAPTSKGGNHLITISDGNSELTAEFAMDSIPPAQPALILPAPQTKASKNMTFSWQAVSDLSDATYTLQIATDSTFSSLVLHKQGLTAVEYTLTEQNILEPVSKKKPYYWRVKATDGASNESDWSAPSTFYVGLVLADWTLYIIFAGIAILCGVFGFMLGTRFRPRPPATSPPPSEQL